MRYFLYVRARKHICAKHSGKINSAKTLRARIMQIYILEMGYQVNHEWGIRV